MKIQAPCDTSTPRGEYGYSRVHLDYLKWVSIYHSAQKSLAKCDANAPGRRVKRRPRGIVTPKKGHKDVMVWGVPHLVGEIIFFPCRYISN